MQSFPQKNVLITGANGQLGNTIRKYIPVYKKFKPIFIDKDDLDLTDPNAIKAFFQTKKIDFLINCAAFTNVDSAEQQEQQAYSINRDAVGFLATAAIKHNVKILHISTDYVFSGNSDTPYKENDFTDPKTIYGRSKLEGEMLLLKMKPDSIVIRTSWLYSQYGKNFFLTIYDKALRKERIRVVNDQYGSPTLADDLAKAILELISKDNWISGIYHYSNRNITTWYDFAKEIYKGLNCDENLVNPISSKDYNATAERPKFSALDTSKIKEVYELDIPDWQNSLHSLISKKINYGTK